MTQTEMNTIPSSFVTFTGLIGTAGTVEDGFFIFFCTMPFGRIYDLSRLLKYIQMERILPL
jgi:hypothetical protein